MPLEFDPTKSWADHMAALRAHLDTVDAECAKILFDHLSTLTSGEDPRDRKNRGTFNSAVQVALDALPPAANT